MESEELEFLNLIEKMLGDTIAVKSTLALNGNRHKQDLLTQQKRAMPLCRCLRLNL